MNLTWHIVKKDLRALKWPLLVWSLIIVAKLGVGVVLLTTGGEEDARWFMQMDVMAKMLTALQFVSFVLVAALIQADLLVGTTAFWMTRPISGARLLGAKLLGIGLMFWLLPVLCTLPWWLWCGLGPREIAWAAAELVAFQSIAILLGLMVSTVTDGFGRFLMWTLVLLFAVPMISGIMVYYSTRGQAGPPGELMTTRAWLAFTLAGLATLIVMIHQYLTRHTARSYAIIGVVVAMIVGVMTWWPWSWKLETRLYNALLRHSDSQWPVAAEPAGLRFSGLSAQLDPQRPGSRADRPFWLQTEFSVEGLATNQAIVPFTASHEWRWPDETTWGGRAYSRSNMFKQAAREALQLTDPRLLETPADGRVTMSGAVPENIAQRFQREPARFTGRSRLRLVEVSSATAVPWQAGPRTLRQGVGERIASVEKMTPQYLVTFIRHSPALLIDGQYGLGEQSPLGRFSNYFLVSATRDFVDRGSVVSRGSTRIGSVAVTWETVAYQASQAGVPAIQRMMALESAQLIAVSFEERARFTHEFIADPFQFKMNIP
jgi:hypothetical protein